MRDLECDTAEEAVERREQELRDKLKEVIHCDATNFESFFDAQYNSRQYDIVQSSRCFESVLDSPEAFQQGIVKLASYMKPEGYLILLTALNSEWYSCSGLDYKLYALKVDEKDIQTGVEMAGEYRNVINGNSKMLAVFCLQD